MSRVARAAGAVALAGAGVLAWSLVEARCYVLRQVTVPVLAPGSLPLRVVHVSDLHLVPSQRDKIAWVRDLGTLAPDLVVDTGDNWAHVDAMPALLEALEPLLAYPGVFVMGSNDYYGPVPKNPARYLLGPDHRDPASRANTRELPAGDLVEVFTSAGWLDLNNRRDRLTITGTDVSFVGTDDAHIGRDEFPRPAPGEGGDRSAPGAVVGGLHVGVTHAPYQRVLSAMVDDGVQLAFAGHTHGSQIALPVYGALVTNCDLDLGRAKGLHGWPGERPDAAGPAERSMWLHVSGGLGTSPYAPVRFASRPEATLLTLVPTG